MVRSKIVDRNLGVRYNGICTWVSAWRQTANLICYQGRKRS